MNKGVSYSSKRFLLTLTLCACAVILLQNRDLSAELSFPLDMSALILGLGICFLFFIPAMLIKTRLKSDVLRLAARKKPWERRTAAAVYSVYFLYAAAYFLLPYTDMFCKKYYTDTSPCVVAFLLLLCCVYAARKGVNVITRFGIFLFVLAMATNLLLFGGSLSSLDFRNGSFGFSGGAGAFVRNTAYFVTPCFTAALFACLSGEAQRFRIRQAVTALGLTGLKYALVLFFLTFAVGEYATRQEYRTFVLSRVAHFGEYAGIESFYMALSTMSVFMILSLLLCGVTKAWGRPGCLWMLAAVTGVIFAVQLLSASNPSVSEIFMQPVVLIGFTFLTAVVLPAFYGLRERSFHG